MISIDFILNKISTLRQTKEQIRLAINRKNIELTTDEVFNVYPDKLYKLKKYEQSINFFNLKTRNNTDYSGLVSCYSTHGHYDSLLYMSYIDKALCDSLKYLNTSNVTNIDYTFKNFLYKPNYVFPINEGKDFIIDLTTWDMSNVESAIGTFYSTCANEINLSTWITPKLKYVDNMFCCNTVKLDIRNFDLTNCTQESCNNIFSFYNNNGEPRSIEGAILREIRLDNCNEDTIRKILTSASFPIIADSSVHTIYLRLSNLPGDVAIPQGWNIVYI